MACGKCAVFLLWFHTSEDCFFLLRDLSGNGGNS